MTKDWSGNHKATFSTLGASNHSAYERAEHDFYATDPIAVDKLLEVETLYKHNSIWECASGAGHLSKRLRELGYEVFASDLYDHGDPDCYAGVDFLKSDTIYTDVILTNPPYKYAREFVEHALELEPQKICMFLKITFLEGMARRKLFDKHPPSRVWVFSKRIQCALNGDPEMFKKSSAACYAWFIWEKNSSSKTEVGWI